MRLRATWLALLLPACALGADVTPLVQQAIAAEARLEPAVALKLLLEADAAKPNDPFILQKIARQYSDLTLDQPDVDAKKRHAETALEFSQRAVALKPDDAVNVLSLAVCYGKLAIYSDTRTKVQYSRLVKGYAEQALALDPNYAWAHHLLGRWHYEVAELGMTSKFFVKLLYGGLPPASPAEAVTHLQRAVELEPGELGHWLELGFALAAAGNPTAARQAWTHGLGMPSRSKHDEPAKERARLALARLN